jgi:hypothetical protein
MRREENDSTEVTDLAAALCSEVWQRWKRSSFRPFANANLVAILAFVFVRIGCGLNGRMNLSKLKFNVGV